MGTVLLFWPDSDEDGTGKVGPLGLQEADTGRHMERQASLSSFLTTQSKTEAAEL
jgi:hypothetical protein